MEIPCGYLWTMQSMRTVIHALVNSHLMMQTTVYQHINTEMLQHMHTYVITKDIYIYVRIICVYMYIQTYTQHMCGGFVSMLV